MMKNIFQDLKRKDHKRYLGGLDVFKYIGPGLLVTVGFIDPGNWASNFAAGSEFGYSLLSAVSFLYRKRFFRFRQTVRSCRATMPSHASQQGIWKFPCS